MTQTAKITLTATAAALLGAGLTLTTAASGWTMPALFKDRTATAADVGSTVRGRTASRTQPACAMSRSV